MAEAAQDGAIEVRAAVCREFGAPLAVETLRLDAPRGREVRVRVLACAICHSDIIYMDGGWGGTLPAVFGHEVAGVVTEVGPAAVFCDAEPGDLVMVSLLRSCGACASCESGTPSQCVAEFESDSSPRLRDASGKPVRAGLRVGGFAESVVVDCSQIVRLPAGLAPETACLISCGVLTGFGAAVNTARLRVGDAAAVVGCGGVGLNSIRGASLAGAHPVVALDISDEKLGIAKEFGATSCVNAADPDFVAKSRELAGGRGFDAVIVAVGNARAISQATGLLARNGALVAAGMPGDGDNVAIEMTALSDLNNRILGCKMGGSRLRTDAPKLFSLMERELLRLDDLVSSRRPLGEINEALGPARASQHLRHVIEFPGHGAAK